MPTPRIDWKATVRTLAEIEGWTLERAVRRAADWADEHYPGTRGLGMSNLSKRLSPKDNPKYGVDPRILEAFAGAFDRDPATLFVEYRFRTMTFDEMSRAADALEAFETSSRPVTEVAAEAARRTAERTGQSPPSPELSHQTGRVA